jgi:AhpD family alkylhydroperoxidase
MRLALSKIEDLKGREMTERLNFLEVAPEVVRTMFGLEKYLAKCGLEKSLLHLVKMRASQINGCAFCLDMHSKDARADGESEQRLYLLDAWHEAPAIYSDRERAALAWTEAVTLVADSHVPDKDYEIARAQFSETELANLTLAIIAINGWNRLNIAFRTPAGNYQPGMLSATA